MRRPKFPPNQIKRRGGAVRDGAISRRHECQACGARFNSTQAANATFCVHCNKHLPVAEVRLDR